MLGKNLENIGVKFDIAQVIKGLQDASVGKESPMTEIECVQAITSVQEKLFKEESEKNLKKAESFLAENAAAKEMVSLNEGKVLYKVEKKAKAQLSKLISHR